MKIFKLLFILLFAIPVWSKTLSKRIPVYGVVKPLVISTNVSIGNGLVHKLRYKVGDSVKPGKILIEILERESLRNYRSTIVGKVAKIHVTAGASVSPGMPLVTVVDENKSYIEISLAPDDARLIQKGAKVINSNGKKVVGEVNRISSIVDPDTGAILAFLDNLESQFRIGEVIPLEIFLKDYECDEVIAVSKLGNYTKGWQLKFISGDKGCLKKESS